MRLKTKTSSCIFFLSWLFTWHIISIPLEWGGGYLCSVLWSYPYMALIWRYFTKILLCSASILNALHSTRWGWYIKKRKKILYQPWYNISIILRRTRVTPITYLRLCCMPHLVEMCTLIPSCLKTIPFLDKYLPRGGVNHNQNQNGPAIVYTSCGPEREDQSRVQHCVAPRISLDVTAPMDPGLQPPLMQTSPQHRNKMLSSQAPSIPPNTCLSPASQPTWKMYESLLPATHQRSQKVLACSNADSHSLCRDPLGSWGSSLVNRCARRGGVVRRYLTT